MELLECPLCLFLMCEPVTVPCGHSFCRRCVKDFLPSKCPQCKERLKPREVRDMRNNVLLISVAEKCWPEESKMKCHIQEKLKASLFMEALRITNEGIDSVPGDLSLKFYRAEANLGLMHLHDALTDLDYLCCLRPNWTEGLFRKGNVLLEMGQPTQALIQFHRCLKVQADFVPAKSQIKKVFLSSINTSQTIHGQEITHNHGLCLGVHHICRIIAVPGTLLLGLFLLF